MPGRLSDAGLANLAAVGNTTMKTFISSALVAAAFLSTVPAAAAVVQGDFRTESDLPYYSAFGPLVYQNIGAVLGAGYELDGDNFAGNPSNWGGGVVFADYCRKYRLWRGV